MKMYYVHCPMSTAEEVLDAIIKAAWKEQCRNLEELR